MHKLVWLPVPPLILGGCPQKAPAKVSGVPAIISELAPGSG